MKEQMVQKSIRLPAEIANYIEDLRKKEKRTFTAQVEVLLEKAVEFVRKSEETKKAV